ncbi:MAG: hypothetical protein P0116_01435 [Candidatus Nitrosocosmicus sp.]|nr:hypothetical protein [Candidatus Nitrosocosmicus sp.]
MVGGDNIIVKVHGKIRTCRIRGKIKKEGCGYRDNDLVLIAPWDFQSDKADIIWRYITPTQTS